MTPQLTQKEMENYTNNKKEYLWAYNTLYTIDYSSTLREGEYYLRKIHTQTKNNCNVSKRGRFISMSNNEAYKYIQ